MEKISAYQAWKVSAINLALALFLASFVFMTALYALDTNQPVEPPADSDTPLPTVPITQQDAPEAPATEEKAASSTDFLSQFSPLQKTEAGEDDVAVLIAESCGQGKGSDGTTSCDRIYSNGHHATVITQEMTEGDEFKVQNVITEYDKDNVPVYKKTMRHRVDYNYYGEEKKTEKELIDIIYQFTGKRMTRDLMTREYHLDTGQMKSLTWAQYEQIGDSDKAALVYYADLHYADDGTPLRGVAERWARGEKVAVYLDWNSVHQGRPGFDNENWREWESWIQSLSLQAYLP